ncbi:MAG: pyridoxamine 5'-phosphate oxidase family protein [Acidimicrobiia bacterium]
MAIIGLEDLSADECWNLIADVPVGRVYVDAGEHPAIMPVIFIAHARTIAFRTAPGDKLIAAVLHRPSVFEVDVWDEATHDGWSVNVSGTLHEVTDHTEIAALDAFGLPAWAAPEARDRWVQLVPDHVSGRRLFPGTEMT